ncbi:MAG: hypothetical protein GVY19_12845 [Bacteroidetes bacterium]|jgi:hypothetical protein|nr:hypothetical protein [Bacteroidota bacterium]
MIKKITRNDKKTKEEINAFVGKAFSLWDRIKMGGLGSTRYLIKESSDSIQQILNTSDTKHYCNIELRPGGIILNFRSLQEIYAWVVPFYKLHVYKQEIFYSFYANTDYMSIQCSTENKKGNDFIRRILEAKAEASRHSSMFHYYDQ